MRPSRWRCGKSTAGSITKIREAGFSGIAVISWVADALTTSGKSNAGVRWAVTSLKSKGIVRPVRSIVGVDSDKPCCIGRMTLERSDGKHRHNQNCSNDYQWCLLDHRLHRRYSHRLPRQVVCNSVLCARAELRLGV